MAKKNYAAALAQQCKAIPNVGLGLAISTVSLTTILWFPARNLLYIPHKQCNLSLIAPITDKLKIYVCWWCKYRGVNISEAMYSQVSAQLESNCPMLKKQKCRSLSFWVTIRFIDVSVLLNKQNREINLEIISHFSPCALPLLNQDKHYRESIKTKLDW